MLKLGLAAWLAATGVCAWEHASSSDLETSIKSQDAVVVAFVAPSEEKSKALELEWTPAVAELTAISTLSVDCSQAADVCQQHGVSSYPSLKLFQGGEPKSTYLGPRRASAITSWISRVQRPLVSEVPSQNLEAFKSGDETVFLAYLSADDQASRKAYDDIASQFWEEFTFGVNVDDDAVRQAEGVGYPGLKCHRHLDGDVVTFKGSFNADALKAFVIEASRSIISELTVQNQQRLVDRAWPMVYLFAATEPERAEFRRALQKIGRSYYESLTMTTVDPLDFSSLPARLGLASGDNAPKYPCGAVHQLSNDRIYHYPRDYPVTPSALQKWGLDVWQGRVQPWSPDGADAAATKTQQGNEMPGRIRATPRVSIASFPGLNIRIGRDEL